MTQPATSARGAARPPGMTREQLRETLMDILLNPASKKLANLGETADAILAEADQYAAHMIEKYARPRRGGAA